MRQPPWMSVVAAHQAAPTLQLSTGIAVAFPRSPMVIGADRVGAGRGDGWTVPARYRQPGAGVHRAPLRQPSSRRRSHGCATTSWRCRRAGRAFRGERAARPRRPLLPAQPAPAASAPPRHEHEDLRIDIAAVGPPWCAWRGEVADGIHVHPLHSVHYLQRRLVPGAGRRHGAGRARPVRRRLDVPVFAVPGDTPEERAPLVERGQDPVRVLRLDSRTTPSSSTTSASKGRPARLGERFRPVTSPGWRR